MQVNERLEKFLTLQNQNIKFDDISKELGVASKTLRSFLNKKGYKMENGIYTLKEEVKEVDQIAFTDLKEKTSKSIAKSSKTTKASEKTKSNKSIESKKSSVAKSTKTSEADKTTKDTKTSKTAKVSKTTKTTETKKSTAAKSEVQATKKTSSKIKPKADRKINVNQEDLDKLCEVYDWYLGVKDNKTFKQKKNSNKKDIVLDEEKLEELKSTTIRVDKSTWEDFERLCSNSQYSKQEIITQALKDFMKEYKYLL